MKLSEIHKPTRDDRNSVMLKAIKQAQSEAISETVNACAKAAKIKSDQHPGSKFDPRPVFTYEVDKQSIVDVEQQLKSQL